MTPEQLPRAMAILQRAVAQWEEPIVGHYKADAFATLISCLLSLRTKDAVTAEASRRLFARARTPQQLLRLSIPTIERLIYPVGFYKTKARTLHSVCRDLLARFGGRVPGDLDALLTITGVGRKTANLVVTLAFRQPGICVDTHVHRITNRWGYVKTRTPEETEMALRRTLPRRYWLIINDLLVTYGQHLCGPVSPRCSACTIAFACDRVGVRHSR